MKKGLFGILGALFVVLVVGLLIALAVKFRPQLNTANSKQSGAPVANLETQPLVPQATPEGTPHPWGTHEITIYNWANYSSPEVYELFEKEFGIKVKEEHFDSNETLRNALQSGQSNYDLVMPSDFSIQQLISKGLLAEIDMGSVLNFHNMSAKFIGLHFDPQNKYSAPYLWGTTGLGYNSAKLSTPPTGWADIFEPQRLSNLTNRVSMLDDARESIGAALKYLGFSINTRNPQELALAQQVLERQRAVVARYDTDTFRDFLISGDMFLVHGWSGDVARARASRPEVHYVIPKEGSTIWADNMAIPTSAKHKKAAEAFINFILRPEIGAKLVNHLKFPSPNEAARPFIKPEILQDQNIFPTDETFSKLEWIQDVGEANATYEKMWTDVKSK